MIIVKNVTKKFNQKIALEEISFEVNKGFKSFVEGKATDIYGNLFVKWTVTKTYTGARVQNWSTSFTSYTGQNFTDSYKETVK